MKVNTQKSQKLLYPFISMPKALQSRLSITDGTHLPAVTGGIVVNAPNYSRASLNDGVCSEKCVVRRFLHSVNIIECT